MPAPVAAPPDAGTPEPVVPVAPGAPVAGLVGIVPDGFVFAPEPSAGWSDAGSVGEAPRAELARRLDVDFAADVVPETVPDVRPVSDAAPIPDCELIVEPVLEPVPIVDCDVGDVVMPEELVGIVPP